MKPVEFIAKGKVQYGASKAQLKYLKSLGAQIDMFDNRFLNHFTSRQASEAIDLLKAGREVIFK